jgi:hypothetical protein
MGHLGKSAVSDARQFAASGATAIACETFGDIGYTILRRLAVEPGKKVADGNTGRWCSSVTSQVFRLVADHNSGKRSHEASKIKATNAAIFAECVQLVSSFEIDADATLAEFVHMTKQSSIDAANKKLEAQKQAHTDAVNLINGIAPDTIDAPLGELDRLHAVLLIAEGDAGYDVAAEEPVAMVYWLTEYFAQKAGIDSLTLVRGDEITGLDVDSGRVLSAELVGVNK